MKKIIVVGFLCFLLVGCGSKKATKKNNTPKETEEEQITLRLGNENMTFKEQPVSCGNYQVQSSVTFNSDGTASYEFYTCNDENVNLETSEGTYETNDLEAVITNKYEEQIMFEITSNSTIDQKDNGSTVRTFTK